MKLSPPISSHVSGPKPTHAVKAKLGMHVTLCKQTEIEHLFTKAGFLTAEGKITKQAVTAGLVDTCDGKPLWNLKEVKKTLLQLTKPAPASPAKAAPKPLLAKPPAKSSGPVWTDLENIGTYFGVGKNKIGSWLDTLGLRGYKPVELNESGDVDMLDVANASKEKFKLKIPTEKALAHGYARSELIEYKQKGKDKSFEKYSWDRDRVKDLLVKAGHPLDTERKLLLKGKGKNSSVTVTTIDQKVDGVYKEWKKLFRSPSTQDDSWRYLEKQSRAIQIRMEQRFGYPRFLQDKLYKKPGEIDKINV